MRLREKIGWFINGMLIGAIILVLMHAFVVHFSEKSHLIKSGDTITNYYTISISSSAWKGVQFNQTNNTWESDCWIVEKNGSYLITVNQTFRNATLSYFAYIEECRNETRIIIPRQEHTRGQ